MTRLRAVLAAATLLALSLALPSQAAPMRCGTGGTYEEAGAGWLALRPEFPAGPAAVTAIASPAFRPDTVYATNGRVVMKTEDGGCGWTPVLDVVERLAGLVDSPFPARVVALATPSSATSSRHVYVAVEQRFLDEPPRPSVLSSGDYGKTWLRTETGPSGLPPVGRIRELAVCNLVAEAAYVLVDVPNADGAPTTALYQTTDAGLTWQRRTSVVTSFTHRGLLVNPLVPSVVFALSGGGIEYSDTSGTTFSPIGPREPATQLAGAVGQGYVRIAAGHADTRYAHISDDGGASWQQVRTPVAPRHVAVAPLRAVMAVTDGERIAVVGQAMPPVDVTPSMPDVRSLTYSAPTQKGTSLVGLAGGVVLRAVLDLQTFRPVQIVRPVRLLPAVPPNFFPPAMLPPAAHVSLPAGGSADVPFTLLLPRTPSPIDVMFLIDSTGSMQPVIDGLKQSMAAIVNELSTIGLDVRFGVGDFRDIPNPHGKGPAGDSPYRLFRRIGPADQEMQDAITQITAGGGNGITSALVAVTQTTTGSGYRALDKELVVPPGQDAKFRPDTLRLAVVITDIGMAQGGNYPSIEGAAKILRAHNVRAVGLAVRPDAREDESELARLTDAVTPPGGLDCNGDGRNDLAGGDPLVCDAPMQGTGLAGIGTPVNLAPAVVALTERATDLRKVVATLEGPARYATLAAGALHPAVNLKADNELPVTVRFTCPPDPRPSRHEFRLTAAPPGVGGASATATLECGPAAAKRKKPLPEEILPLPGAVPVAAAAAAPGPPPPNPVPQPNPNPNPNPNPGVNANVGMADQREDQFQLALANNEDTGAAELPGQILAMSRRREADPALLLGPAALLVATATWAARRRFAPRSARARW